MGKVKVKIKIEETVRKIYEIEVEAPEGVTVDQVDNLCNSLERKEFTSELINDLRMIEGYKVIEVVEGVAIGEIEINELEEIEE